MFKSFIISFKLKNTYRVNTILYSLKQLPIVKKILPDALYSNQALKIFANIISVIGEITGIFIGKLIYLMVMIFFASRLYQTNQGNTFLHIFIFLTITGSFLNTYLFSPTKDKHYAIMLLKMEARKYTLSNYYYALLKLALGFVVILAFLFANVDLPVGLSLLAGLWVVMVKVIACNWRLNNYQRTKKLVNENKITKELWVVIVILLLLGYGLPWLKITLTPMIFMIIFVITIPLALWSFKHIHQYDHYQMMCKQLLVRENIYLADNQMTNEAIKESIAKQISIDQDYVSHKTGFAYFHDLFVQRHRKILLNTVKKQAIGLAIVFALIIIGVSINQGINDDINHFVLSSLPFFTFIMYFLNRGTKLTQAMFMNCDHSMLTYRIYRSPRVIIGMFKERLKTLIKLNLISSLVIAVGLPLLLFITGGTDNGLNYMVLFVAIVAMSIFFSVHYLVMYYLLQPYNVNTEIKSSTYSVAQSLTYFVCYLMIRIELPTVTFGLGMVGFSLFYCLIALLIVYKYAPITFKIRN